jgi:hypothetical protein
MNLGTVILKQDTCYIKATNMDGWILKKTAGFQ